MTLFIILLLLVISATLSFLLKKQPPWVNFVLQIIMAFVFLYSVVLWQLTPNKIHQKKLVKSKGFTIQLLSKKMIQPLRMQNRDPYYQKDRIARYPYFDKNNTLLLEQKIVNWNVGDVCTNSVATNDDGSMFHRSDTLYLHPRIDLEFCKSETPRKLGDRILVAIENDKIKWQYSLLIKKVVRSKTYRDLFRVIGKNKEFIILYNYDEYEIKIISAQTGHEIYPNTNNLKLEFKDFGPAAYDKKNNLIYKVNNDYGDNSPSILVQTNLITGQKETLYEFPIQSPVFLIGSGVPSHAQSISYLSKLNLLVIYNRTSSYGTTNDKLYVYSIDSKKIIFEKDYRPRGNNNPVVINQTDSSFGVYHHQILEHYKISKNN